MTMTFQHARQIPNSNSIGNIKLNSKVLRHLFLIRLPLHLILCSYFMIILILLKLITFHQNSSTYGIKILHLHLLRLRYPCQIPYPLHHQIFLFQNLFKIYHHLFFRSSRPFNPLSRFDDTPISSLIHLCHP